VPDRVSSRVGKVTVESDPSGARWQCLVAVETGGKQTGYAVTVTRGDLQKWGRGERPSDVVDLVVRSFEFLLEREPASSILKSFDLAVIPRYFPEYNALFNHA